MSIAFEPDEVHLQKLRERLRKMSEDELIKFGKTLRFLSGRRVSVTPDPWRAQLIEARDEWETKESRTLKVGRRTTFDARAGCTC
jgi:hypothetical protein